jgi:hypothetical protein
VFESLHVYRFEDRLGRSMWEFPGGDGDRFLVMALTGQAAAAGVDGRDLIVYGTLLEREVVGFAGCVQAVDSAAALGVLGLAREDGVTVRPWRFGGRA